MAALMLLDSASLAEAADTANIPDGMSLPADGVSGATRAPGRQTIAVPGARLRNLQPGQYNIVVEAARELGGREVVRVPFRWGAANAGAGTGSTDLGAVRVAVSR